MNQKDLARHIETMRNQVLALHEGVKPLAKTEFMLAALNNLDQALEELYVAEEELRVQQEELESTRARSERERQRYQSLFEIAPDAYLITDIYGIIQEANRNAAALLKMEPNRMIGKPLAIFIVPEQRGTFRATLNRALRWTTVHEWDARIQIRTGLRCDVALRLNVERDSAGNAIQFRWLIRDITLRQQTLQRSEERLRIALKAARLGYWDWNLETNVVIVSPEHNVILGLPPELQEGHYEVLMEQVHPDDRESLAEILRRAIQTHCDYEAEFRVIWPDGSQHWVCGNGKVFYDEQLRAERMVGVVQDITEARNRTEERQRQQQALLEQEREAAILQERNRLALEIHDTLAQGFMGIFMQLEAAEDALANEPGAVQKHITLARELTRSSLAEARRSVQALRPRHLEEEGLVGALRQLIWQAGLDAPVQIHFVPQENAPVLPQEKEQHLLRIAQEAIWNALQHSQADEIVVELRSEIECLTLKVRDNGLGFDPGIRPTNHFGLIGIEERACHIGGTVQIESHLGKGTCIIVTVPCKGSEQ